MDGTSKSNEDDSAGLKSHVEIEAGASPNPADSIDREGRQDRPWQRKLCPFCKLLLSQAAPPGEQTPIVEYHFSGHQDELEDDVEPPNCDLYSIVRDLYRIWCQGQPALRRYAYLGTCCLEHEARVDYENLHLLPSTYSTIDLTPIPYTTMVESDPLNASTVTRIRQWIEICDKYHESCQTKELPLLPTRVLDVGTSEESETVALVETLGKRGEYIALSHCWGMSNSFLTTRETREDMKRGFHLNQAPKTFVDAILVTRKLGIRYLWIDSLCIIQGDTRDWEIESSKMGGVYRNAYLTIAASNASGDEEGFLKSRPPPLASLKVYSPSGNDSVGIHLCHIYSSEAEPLTSRAWTLQEAYLSRRQLKFLKHQIQWACDGYVRVEVNDDCQGRNLENLKELFPDESGPTLTAYRGWYKMIEDYSERQLSFHSDRLPALSGIASEVADHTSDRYIAGIWETNAALGICWKRSYQNSLTKPDCYIAPSWSWVSALGRIEFLSSYDPRITPLEIVNVKSYSIRMWHQGSYSFGRIRDGCWIKIEAPVASFAKMRQDSDRHGDLSFPRGGNENFKVDFDFEEEDMDHPEDLRVLVLLRSDHGFVSEDTYCVMLYGIVIQYVRCSESIPYHKFALRAGNRHIYKRVGFFTIRKATEEMVLSLDNLVDEIVLV